MQLNIKRLLTLLIAMSMVSSVFVVTLDGLNLDYSNNNPMLPFSVPSNGLIGNFSDGSNAFDGVYDPYNQEIYITNNANNNVTVLNAFSGVSVANISVGSHPEGITYVPYNHDIYVNNFGSYNISVISSITNNVISTINVTGEPKFSSYDPNTETLFVSGILSGGGFLSFVNVTNNNVTLFNGLFPSSVPFGMAFDPYTGNMYVADYGNNLIFVLSSSQQILTYISVGQNPYGLAFDSSNKMLYVTDYDSNGFISGSPQQYNVSVVNTMNNTLVTNIQMQKAPEGILYDPMNGLIYVSNYVSGNVSVISPLTNTVIQLLNDEVGTQRDPSTSLYDPVLQQVVSVNDVSGIDTTKNFNSAGGFAGPYLNLPPAYAVVYNPENNYLYLSPQSHESINIYSLTGILMDQIGFNGDITALAYGNNTIFAASGPINQLYLIGALNNTVYKTISFTSPANNNPDGLAYDSLNNTLFISFGSSNDVGVLDLSNYIIIKNLEVGINPAALTFSNITDQVYVAQNDENIHIINASSYANVYPYSVSGSNPSQVAYDPYTNSIYIANTGNDSMFVINVSKINLQSDDSTPYQTVFLGSPQQGISFDPSNGLLYIEQTSSQNFTIFNPLINKAVGSINSSTITGNGPLTYIPAIESFIPVGGQSTFNVISTSKLFAVSMNVGDQIPVGNDWNLQIQPSIDSTFAKVITSKQSSNVTFYTALPNGTYDFNVSTSFSGVDPYHGYFVINGTSTSISLYYYVNVTFKENGLNPGIEWAVSAGGSSAQSTSNSDTLQLTPGTYNAYITGSMDYEPYPSSLILNVPDHSINQTVYFQSPGSKVFGYVDNTTSLYNGTTYAGDSFIPVMSSAFALGGAYDPQIGLLLVEENSGGTPSLALYNTTDYSFVTSVPELVNHNNSYALYNPEAVYFDPADYMFYVIGNNNVVASVYPINGTIDRVVNLSGQLLPTLQGSGNLVFAMNTTGTIFEINIMNQSVKSFNLDLSINGSVMIPYHDSLFLLNSSGNGLIEFNTLNGSVKQLPFSEGFDAAHVVSGQPGTLYISGKSGGFLEVFNESTGTVVNSIELNSQLGGLVYSGNFVTAGIYDPFSGLMYFSSGASTSEYSFGNFTVYNPSTGEVISSFPGLNSSSSIYMVYDSSSQKIFAAGLSSDTMTVISPLAYYNVTVKETGLPSGTSWTIKLSDGRTFTTIGNSITFTAANNVTYSYTAKSTNSSYDSTTGTFTTDGHSISIDANFTVLKYSVRITESGLSSGTRWFVDVNGVQYNSTSSTISLSLPNGTYSYSVDSISGYAIKNQTGYISVIGGANIQVKFTHSSPISSTTEAIIAGVVVVLVAVGLTVGILRLRKGGHH